MRPVIDNTAGFEVKLDRPRRLPYLPYYYNGGAGTDGARGEFVPSPPWSVHKFGGTSVADADGYRNAGRIVGSAEGAARCAVVVSAMAGVTDELIALLDLARSGDELWPARLDALRDRQLATVEGLLSEAERPAVEAAVRRGVEELGHLLRGVRLVRGVPSEALELVSGYGELWSAQTLAAHLRDAGRDAVWVDAREILVVEPSATGTAVQWDASADRLRDRLAQVSERFLVITGFVACTPEGRPTTLGRNGSDFTASIFGALLEAETITIWTDVDGVMSADPNLVPQAFVLPELSYDEAMELAYFGAKVLHPNTMHPAIRLGIPIFIRNSRHPLLAGTRIGITTPPVGPVRPADAVRGFSTFSGLALINVEGSGMVGVPGVAERLFSALGRIGVSVIMISQASSEHSICVAVPGKQAARARKALEEAFFAELHHGQIQRIEVTAPCAILAAVGDAMAETPGVSARFFGALAKAGINVRAVAQGASERNITAVIDEAESVRALRAVHAGFYLSEQTLSVGVVGAGVVGRALLAQLASQRQRLHDDFRIDLRVRGIARTERMLLADPAIDLDRWSDLLAAAGEPTDLDAFVERIDSDEVPHAVLVDCTSSAEIARRYPAWLERGIHVVTPNKKASSDTQEFYRKLRRVARSARTHYLYEATVGAGLPVITTLRDLIRTGDRVTRIEGVLSGTLSYLFNTFSGDPSFSELVRSARDAGYTEPDPRDDLSGMDVARKLIILAREIGLEIELEQIEIEDLVPPPLRGAGRVDEFLAGLRESDGQMLDRLEQARRSDGVLRHVGRIDESGRASVRLDRYPANHPFAGLTGTDNIVAFTTERYAAQPLIVRGPGAGPEVTAGGIFADLLRLTAYLGAPQSPRGHV